MSKSRSKFNILSPRERYLENTNRHSARVQTAVYLISWSWQTAITWKSRVKSRWRGVRSARSSCRGFQREIDLSGRAKIEYDLTVYAIHALATGSWVGGLPPLLSALVEQRRFAPNEARECTLDILSRFSLMAMIAVTLLVASGVANAGFRVAGSFDKLLHKEYGDALFTKIGVVSAMLTLAYFNRFVFMPRLRAGTTKGRRQIIWLGRSVTLELALGVLVLGAAAVLGITPPPQ
jgi:uncharacterized membrane protein